MVSVRRTGLSIIARGRSFTWPYRTRSGKTPAPKQTFWALVLSWLVSSSSNGSPTDVVLYWILIDHRCSSVYRVTVTVEWQRLFGKHLSFCATWTLPKGYISVTSTYSMSFFGPCSTTWKCVFLHFLGRNHRTEHDYVDYLPPCFHLSHCVRSVLTSWKAAFLVLGHGHSVYVACVSYEA